LLAALGADVIKLESHNRADPARGLTERPYAHSTFYEDLNGGKRSIAIDLKTDDGRRTALDLAERCDAVVSSFRPGVMTRLGLDGNEILARNPRAVVAYLSATGSDGPYAGLPGFAGVFNALGGLGSLTGYQDGPPTELRTSIDLRSGAMLAMVVTLALLDVQRTGVGRFLDFSAVEVVALLAGEYLSAELMGARPQPKRIGNRDEAWAPQGTFATRDRRWIALAARDDDEWALLVDALGGAGDNHPAHWSTNEGRLADQDAVEAMLAERIASFDVAGLSAELAGRGIPAECVLSADEVANDATLRNAGFFQPVDGLNDIGEQTVAVVPWLIDGERPPVLASRPLGVDTDSVLTEMLGSCDTDPDHPEPLARPVEPDADPIRVLELGQGFAAPFAGRVFAEVGAEVVKVELSPNGDPSRARPPLVDIDGTAAGAMFHFLNAGKRSMLLDGTRLDEIVDELWDWADVVLIDETFLRLDGMTARLDRNGPHVVGCVTPFGRSGGDHDRAATSSTLFARGGEAGITPGGLGHQLFPDAPPLGARGKVAEIDAGVIVALVAAAGLCSRSESPASRPMLIDVSMHEVAVSNNRWIPGNFLRSGWIETRESRPYPYGGLLPCKDGHAMFLPSTNGHWAALVDIMGRPEWALDEDFATYAGRAHNAPKLRAGLREWAETQTMDELLVAGLAHGVPIGPYRTAPEVAMCPHLTHRGFFAEYGSDGGARIPGLPSPGLRQNRASVRVAPRLGADTEWRPERRARPEPKVENR
jgi:crotonobetainyl-CoA:carnitine CoA-transferase CaiB-like acyl-CoA transferase